MRFRRRPVSVAPSADVASYGLEWDVPAAFNFTRDVVEPLAAEQGRRALTFVDASGIVERIAFAEVARRAAAWAGAFRAQGLEPGDRVLVLIGKRPEWHTVVLGALKAGLVVVPCSEMLRPNDLAFRARHSGARLLVSLPVSQPVVLGLLELVDDVEVIEVDDETSLLHPFQGPSETADTLHDDPAFILYTSGTTKEPKGVTHTHAYTYASRMQAEYWLDARPDDLVWCTAGTGWAKSIWNVLLGPWSAGAEVVLHEGAFEPTERLELIDRLGVTVLCQAPTEYRLMAKLDDLPLFDLGSVRHAVSAGEPLNPEVIEVFRDTFGLTIYDGYGQTENSLLVANTRGMEVRPGSMGRPTPGHRVAVIDEAGVEVEPGVEGDVAVLGTPPTLFTGYWGDPEATLATRRAGWYVSGDRAVADEDGYLWFTGRADDVIVSAAYRIGPFEVESALLEHPAVAESAAVGKPHPDRGQIVKAFVVLRPGVTGDDALVRELQEHVKAVTAPYKYPREIEFVGALPKTTSGKIRRVELRALESARSQGWDGAATVDLPVAAAGPAAELAARDAARIEEDSKSRRALAEAERAAQERIESERREARRLTEEAEARRRAEERERAEAEARAEAERIERERAAAAARRAEAERIERERREAEERARAEAERIERERREAEERARAEAERVERERREAEARAEAERIERERREAEARAEAERVERERREAEERARAEAERVERERREAEARAEAERIERERREAEERARAEAERVERERREAEARAEAERVERERREAEARAEAERIERERREAEARAEAERIERERREAEERARAEAQARARAEAVRIERERREAEARAEAERIERERGEAEERARAEAARIEAERIERERLQAEARAEAERVERERREAEERARAEAQARARAEAERIERERREAEERARAEAARAEAERIERERREAEERARAEAERIERQRQAEVRARAEAERLEAELRERERLTRHRREADARAQAVARARAEAERRRREMAETRAAEARRAEQERIRQAHEQAEAEARRREAIETERLRAVEEARAAAEQEPAAPAGAPGHGARPAGATVSESVREAAAAAEAASVLAERERRAGGRTAGEEAARRERRAAEERLPREPAGDEDGTPGGLLARLSAYGRRPVVRDDD